MIPVPIPDNKIWEGGERTVILPPDGDMFNESIRSVEAVREVVKGDMIYNILLKLEAGDLERLQSGADIWLSIWGVAIPPFCLTVTDG